MTTRLLTAGAYKLIRHPRYSPPLLPAWGAFLEMPSWVGTTLTAATAFPMVTAKAEEAANIEYFEPVAGNYLYQRPMSVTFAL